MQINATVEENKELINANIGFNSEYRISTTAEDIHQRQAVCEHEIHSKWYFGGGDMIWYDDDKMKRRMVFL